MHRLSKLTRRAFACVVSNCVAADGVPRTFSDTGNALIDVLTFAFDHSKAFDATDLVSPETVDADVGSSHIFLKAFVDIWIA